MSHSPISMRRTSSARSAHLPGERANGTDIVRRGLAIFGQGKGEASSERGWSVRRDWFLDFCPDTGGVLFSFVGCHNVWVEIGFMSF